MAKVNVKSTKGHLLKRICFASDKEVILKMLLHVTYIIAASYIRVFRGGVVYVTEHFGVK